MIFREIFFREMAESYKCTPIQALALVIKSCRTSSEQLASEVDVGSMIELTTLSSMLSISQLFRGLSSYVTSHEEFSLLKDIWEKFNALGLYYSGTDLFKSYCEHDKYRPYLQHLVAKPANMPSESELNTLNLKYKRSSTTEDDSSNESNVSTMDNPRLKPVAGFYDVIYLRRARLAIQSREVHIG